MAKVKRLEFSELKSKFQEISKEEQALYMGN